MQKIFSAFVKDEGGATAIEYGMIAALIAVVIIGTLQVIGTQLNAKFGSISASCSDLTGLGRSRVLTWLPRFPKRRAA